jgi:hypothetical protein
LTGSVFVVTRRPGSPGTYDFDRASHPKSYGFTIGANAKWTPDWNEMSEEVRSFLSHVDNEVMSASVSRRTWTGSAMPSTVTLHTQFAMFHTTAVSRLRLPYSP